MIQLPNELLMHVFLQIPPIEFSLRYARVCQLWKSIFKDPAFWHKYTLMYGLQQSSSFSSESPFLAFKIRKQALSIELTAKTKNLTQKISPVHFFGTKKYLLAGTATGQIVLFQNYLEESSTISLHSIHQGALIDLTASDAHAFSIGEDKRMIQWTFATNKKATLELPFSPQALFYFKDSLHFINKDLDKIYVAKDRWHTFSLQRKIIKIKKWKDVFAFATPDEIYLHHDLTTLSNATCLAKKWGGHFFTVINHFLVFDLPAEGNRFPLQIYNLKNPESSFQFLAHIAEILDVIVLKCPDGLFSIDLPNKGWVFASHSVDGSIHLFDPLSGFLLISFNEHSREERPLLYGKKK